MAVEPKESTGKGPLRIRFDDARKVLVEDHNEDRILISSEDAVRSCFTQSMRSRIDAELQEALLEAFKRVVAWSAARPQVQRVLVSRPDGDRMLFLIVVAGRTHDFSLDDEISDLSLDVASRLNWMPSPVTVMTVPAGVPDALDSYIDLDDAFEIYAKPGQA